MLACDSFILLEGKDLRPRQTGLLRGNISLALNFPGKLVMISSACSLPDFTCRERTSLPAERVKKERESVFLKINSSVASIKGGFLKVRSGRASLLLTSKRRLS